MVSRGLKVLLITIAAIGIGGCSTIEQKRKIDYRNTRALPPLEVPPDLSTLPDREAPAGSSSATYSDLAKEQQNPAAAPINSPVLPQYPGLRVAREGQTRWLVVAAEPTQLWEPVREFVQANGLLIAEENPASGVIETDWAENRAKVGTGTQNLLTKWVGSLYSTGTRDKYRLRLERGTEPGTTEIYLTHQGMVEELPENSATTSSSSVWTPRPSDPELEAEMLHRLMAHLGGQRATQTAAAQQPATPAPSEAHATLKRNGNGLPMLTLQDSLDRAWRRVGLSLDRIGFTVEDRDRSKGVYYVRYIDPDAQGKDKGLLGRWFGDDAASTPHQYQVSLKPAPSGTEVAVLDKNGAPENSKTGERILSLLYDQLK